jgi:competence protein ComEA
MDRIAEWRPVEPAGPDGSAVGDVDVPRPADENHAGNASNNRRLIAAAAIAVSTAGVVVAVGMAVIVLGTAPKPAVAIDSHASPAASTAAGVALSPTVGPGEVVVDVEGAVNQSGLFRLAEGSRIGDAIAAAGGYSAQVDIEAATGRLNLAQVLVDGQQIHVPLRGEVTTNSAAVAPSQQPSAGSAPIDINTATAEELDTLPGIGPVTAAKIIAARQERAFASVDDLAQRDVVGAATLEKLRALITVTP